MIVDIYAKDTIVRMASNHGFRDPAILEKFIMNLHIYDILSKHIECYLRGGLCVPFYATAPMAKRLSIDLDLYVKNTYMEMAERVPQILTAQMMECKQDRPGKVKNLLQFQVGYITPRLQIRERARMKLDIVCEADIPFPFRTIRHGHELFIGKTEQDITAITHGFLIADKITSVATNTIGYSQVAKVPKQIHDIGYLLGSASSDDIEEAITTFDMITKFKTSRHKDRPSVENVVYDINRFVKDLLVMGNVISIQKQYLQDFEGNFQKQFLSRKLTYEQDELMSNILKTWIYALGVKETTISNVSSGTSAKLVYDAINSSKNHKDRESHQSVDKLIKDLRKWFPETQFTDVSPRNLHMLHRIHQIMRQ